MKSIKKNLSKTLLIAAVLSLQLFVLSCSAKQPEKETPSTQNTTESSVNLTENTNTETTEPNITNETETNTNSETNATVQAEPNYEEYTESESESAPMISLIKTTAEPITRTDFYLGTVCVIKIYDSADENILTQVFERIAELDEKINSNTDDSEVGRINKEAGKSPVAVSDDTFRLIKCGLYYSELSNGLFDISIGPITNLWRIGFPDARKPSQDEIDNALQYVDYKDIELNEDNKTVFLKNEHMRLDLGAVAKGFVTDEVVEVLANNGVKSAIINLGGNIFAYGTKANNAPWNIGVQDPYGVRDEWIGIIKIRNQTQVTSGIYVRNLEVDGVNYHHLLNPNDGYPFFNELESVTIVCDKSVDAEGLSTTTFAYGLNDGIAFIESLENVEAVFVTHDKKVYITSGLKSLYNHTNYDFTLMN